ncbi:MAG: hypothetical protein M9904_11065 [Chitinophagaceae bacterium]|nr:hypothetical protein [Chitinophagaceae bacterium]
MLYLCGALVSLITYRHCSVLLLLAALLIQSFNRMLVIGDYYINTGSYAANCENKVKVEMHCNGKCQMTKKLRQEEEKDKNNPQRKVENHNEFFTPDDGSFVLSPIMLNNNSKRFALLSETKTLDHPHSIFRPPIA